MVSYDETSRRLEDGASRRRPVARVLRSLPKQSLRSCNRFDDVQEFTSSLALAIGDARPLASPRAAALDRVYRSLAVRVGAVRGLLVADVGLRDRFPESRGHVATRRSACGGTRSPWAPEASGAAPQQGHLMILPHRSAGSIIGPHPWPGEPLLPLDQALASKQHRLPHPDPEPRSAARQLLQLPRERPPPARRRLSGRGVATGSVIGLSVRGRDCWPSHGSDAKDRGSAAGLSSGGRRSSSSAVRTIAISAEGGTSSIAIPRTQPMRTVPLRRAATASSSVTESSSPSCCCACRCETGSVCGQTPVPTGCAAGLAPL